jgi:hypothetical protein
MAFLGYALGLFLLLSIGRFGWASLVFPLWSLVISVYVLFANFRPRGVQGRNRDCTYTLSFPNHYNYFVAGYSVIDLGNLRDGN